MQGKKGKKKRNQGGRKGEFLKFLQHDGAGYHVKGGPPVTSFVEKGVMVGEVSALMGPVRSSAERLRVGGGLLRGGWIERDKIKRSCFGAPRKNHCRKKSGGLFILVHRRWRGTWEGSGVWSPQARANKRGGERKEISF